MNILKTFFVFVFVVIVSGCATVPLEPIQIDPSYNRAVVYNNSPYVVQLDGVFNKSIRPGEEASVNVPCYGTFDVLATAYRVVGTRGGREVLEYYGQINFSVHIDGKNYVVNEKSVDDYYAIYDSSFHPYTPYRRQYKVAPKVTCGIVSGTLTLGR